MPGEQVDTMVMAMLGDGNTKRRLVAIELMGRRRMTGRVDTLLEIAGREDGEVRRAAIRMMGELGGAAQAPALLALLMESGSPEDAAAAERALGAVYGKAEDPEAYGAELIELMGNAGPAHQAAILRLLGGIGGTEALAVVRKSAADFDSEIGGTAVSVLCAWKTADAAPALLELNEALPEPSRRIAALRGYMNLVRDEGLSTEQKITMCKEAEARIGRDEEKLLLLSVLGTVVSEEALSMAMDYLDSGSVRTEAGFAAVSVGDKLAEQKPDIVADAMRKVIEVSDNEGLTRRAGRVLEKVEGTE
jgi:HEAT repeat protein